MRSISIFLFLSISLNGQGIFDFVPVVNGGPSLKMPPGKVMMDGNGNKVTAQQWNQQFNEPDVLQPNIHGLPDGNQNTTVLFDSDGNPTTDPNNWESNFSVVQSGEDTDNDVPTLLAIKAKMIALSEQTRGDRRLISLDIKEDGNVSEISFTSESAGELVTLSHLDQNLQKLVELQKMKVVQESNASVPFEELEEGIENERTDLEDATEELENSFQSLKPNLSGINKDDDGQLNIPISNALYRYFPHGSIDLFNMQGIHDLLPTMETFGKFSTLTIGLICLFIYIFAIKEHTIKVIRDMSVSQESNAVTNYSILGNSVGAIGVFAIKTGIVVTMVAGILFQVNVLLSESIDFGIFSGNPINIVANFGNTMSALGGGFKKAIYWLFEFAPILSIISMAFGYFASRYATYIILLLGNRLARLAS